MWVCGVFIVAIYKVRIVCVVLGGEGEGMYIMKYIQTTVYTHALVQNGLWTVLFHFNTHYRSVQATYVHKCVVSQPASNAAFLVLTW